MLLRIRGWFQRLQLMVYTTLVTAMISFSCFFGSRRMSHENGIAVRGRVRIVDNPTFPAHEFFTPGREFAARIRHASVLFNDDAMLEVRSASIKFADSRHDSPFDVLMNNGRVGLFWSARTFVQFMRVSIAGKGKEFVSYLQKNPQALWGGGESSRRNPSSFAEMSYYSQVCFGFTALDGSRYFCRYRLIPEVWGGDTDETGYLDSFWMNNNWLSNPFPDEQRSRNYLKDELRDRLDAGRPVTMRLQIQVRPVPPCGTATWTSAQYPWDEGLTPWHDLAVVTETEALDHTEAVLTCFDLNYHPDSLPVPHGTSIDDPHSLNDLRRASSRATKARLLSYKFRGLPKPLPDSRTAPDWVKDSLPPMAVPPGPGVVAEPIAQEPGVRHPELA
jgi:arachidonate 5-lipoxygenase